MSGHKKLAERFAELTLAAIANHTTEETIADVREAYQCDVSTVQPAELVNYVLCSNYLDEVSSAIEAELDETFPS